MDILTTRILIALVWLYAVTIIDYSPKNTERQTAHAAEITPIQAKANKPFPLGI